MCGGAISNHPNVPGLRCSRTAICVRIERYLQRLMMMMTVIYHESDLSDDHRRPLLYAGDLFVFTPRPSTLELIKHAREMIEGVFGDDPTHAQFGMAVEKFVELGGPLKPAFIHHPRTKELIRDVVADIGCSLEDTYLDVPRLRLATSNGYLTAGVGYAFHPHRDTWYSAPMCAAELVDPHLRFRP